ncbi:MAG: prepilin-type N-terminal cleavage/methylation domain-containing protein [Lentisphaeria bacterium]
MQKQHVPKYFLFTLTELPVVIAIIAILTLYVIVSLKQIAANNTTRSLVSAN